jgi:hypothetical protein
MHSVSPLPNPLYPIWKVSLLSHCQWVATNNASARAAPGLSERVNNLPFGLRTSTVSAISLLKTPTFHSNLSVISLKMR